MELTIEQMFQNLGVKEVFDTDGHFTMEALKVYGDVSKKYFNDNIDELDKLCEEEKCFDDTCLEHLKLDRCCDFVDLENGHINSYLVKCPCCKGTNIKEIERDHIGYILAESDYYCEDCKKVVAHWAYGNVMP